MKTFKEMNFQIMQLGSAEVSHMDSYCEYCKSHQSNNKFDYISNIVVEDKFLYGKKVFAMTHDRFSLPSYHTHRFMEIIYILEGEFINIIEGQETVMHKGDICVIPPLVYHSIDLTERDIDKRKDSFAINIFIRKSAIVEIFRDIKQESFEKFISGITNSESHRKFAFFSCLNPEISEHIVRLFYYASHYRSPECNEETSILAESLIRCLAAEMLNPKQYSLSFSTSFTGNSLSTNDIIGYISENFKIVTLEDVAKKFNYSFSYASKLIKQRTGLGFSKLLSNMRMDKACELLCGTDMSVQSIASECGYNNIEHFHRSFKAKHGITPSEFRKSDNRGVSENLKGGADLVGKSHSSHQ